MPIQSVLPNVGDIIRMRLADGTEREARFGGSLKDLLTDNGKAPVVRTELMEGVTAVKQGGLRYLEGSGLSNLSPSAHMFLLQASDAGAAAADYLKGYMAGSDNPYATPSPHDLLQQVMSSPRGDTTNPAGEPAEPDPNADASQSLIEKFRKLVNERVRYDIELGDAAEYEGTEKADRVQSRNRGVLNGYGGDDLLSAYDDAKISGGEGNDRIDGYSGLKASGDGGNDIIDAYDRANLSGGLGDDRLSAYNDSTLLGGAGNDHLSAGDKSHLEGGEGHDYISAYSDVTIDGGTGNDYIQAYERAKIDAGEGHDLIDVGGNASVIAGAGNDIIRAGAYATVAGGQGDDSIRVGANATIQFGRGDGVDTLERNGIWDRGGDALASARIVLGPNIAADHLVVTRDGADLRIAIGGTSDALVVRDVELRGVPSVTFADGSSLSGTDLLARAVDMPSEGIVV